MLIIQSVYRIIYLGQKTATYFQNCYLTSLWLRSLVFCTWFFYAKLNNQAWSVINPSQLLINSFNLLICFIFSTRYISKQQCHLIYHRCWMQWIMLNLWLQSIIKQVWWLFLKVLILRIVLESCLFVDSMLRPGV